MMSGQPDLPRSPAYAGVTPTAPSFGPASPDLSALLKASIPGIAGVERLLTDADAGADTRFFRAKRTSGAQLFLKVMSDVECESVAAAEGVLQGLPSGNAAVRSCGIFRLADSSHRVAVAYPYVEARFLEGTPHDMRKLGRSIALLHGELRALPNRGGIRDCALQRARRLDGRLAASDRHRASLAAVGIPPLAPCLVRRVEQAEAQPLHGDLNAGNILCETGDGRIRFLDFEDVRHSFGSALDDLALPLERFCLTIDDKDRAVGTAVAVLTGYADASNRRPCGRPGELKDALMAVNARAVALLMEQEGAGRSSSTEWNKFGSLLRRHAERADVIAAIEWAML
jgi:Ser/Thr protein kinase RdoA (MazF antagonist)